MTFTRALIIFFVLTSASYARGHLNAEEVRRVREFKQLLEGVDDKTVRQAIDELEKSPHPQVNLEIKEAMARTYADIARQLKVEEKPKKEWLYSMVALNMAYLQFGGSRGDSPLNALICRKLKEHLPPGILKQAGFRYSLE